MAKEPENVTLRHLREIRATLEDHSAQLAALPRIEKQLSDLAKLVRYTLGQSEETQFRQSQQEARIDELFQKLEDLLSKPQPT
jgi:hypothetical protein